MNAIQFLKRDKIDEQKWNNAVEQSLNSLPYAYSWYLDSVAENWAALVLGDYQAIMPLVWLYKLGIKCLYQPYYCQQLGIFGTQLNQNVITDFLNYTTKIFLYININLNPSVQSVLPQYKLTSKKNLLLDLNKEYNQLKANYSENHNRNIKKAEKAKLLFSEQTDLNRFQRFYLENINRQQENFKSQHEKIFKQFSKTVIENKTGTIFSTTDKEDNLFAASLVLHHQNRHINIINTSSAIGKSSGASHFLFDHIIQKYAGSKTIFDFEGSSVPGIARFYEGFGAEEEIFYNFQTSIINK